MKKIVSVFGIGMVLWSIGLASAGTHVTTPFQGVVLTQRVDTSPRLLYINVLEINLKTAGIRFYASPGNGDTVAGDTTLQTPQAFLDQAHAQMAVNANFFGWLSGGVADLCGLECSNGYLVSEFSVNYPALNIDNMNVVSIITTEVRNIPLYNAIAGKRLIVSAGVNVAPSVESIDTSLNPRTAIGYTADKKKLIIMTVDGRRDGVSLGVTTPELANLMLQYRAYYALNLDGGGSTQLVVDDSEPRLVNIPSESPRPVGASLAIFANPQRTTSESSPLIAYEGFNYAHRSVGDADDETPSDGGLFTLMGGQGWATGWKELETVSGITGDRYAGVVLYDRPSDISGHRTTPLAYTDASGRKLSTMGGQLRTSFGATSVTTRYIDISQINTALIKNDQIGADGSEIWISFLAQSYDDNTGTCWAYLQLGNGPCLGRFGGSAFWGIQDAQNTANMVFSTANVADSILYLAKVSFMNGNDRVQVWLNPKLSGEDKLGTADMEMSVTDFTFSKVSFIGRYSTDFDELRIGTSFGAVAVPVQKAGDANGDGKVDVGDLGILAANYGKTSGVLWTMGDFNDDGVVDVGDLGILAANYGDGTSGQVDFESDYAKVFGSADTRNDQVSNVDNAEATDSAVCQSIGLSPMLFVLLSFLFIKQEK